jgi:hypothetical protein
MSKFLDNPQTFNMVGDPNHAIATNLSGGLDITGDPNNPVATLIFGDPTKPVATLLEGDPTKPITTLLEGDPTKPITSNSTVKMGLDDIRIKELPHIYFSAEVGMKPTRIHNPLHLKFCLSMLGFEILSFDVCGESMTIIEPYHPHRTEQCS